MLGRRTLSVVLTATILALAIAVQATVSSTTTRNDYTGTGAVATYAYTFKTLAASDLLVTKRNVSTGGETTLVLNTDYSVTGVGAGAGGSITLTAGNLASGYTLTIRRVLPLTQGTDLRNQSPFYAETHESVFDRLTMIDQQQQDDISRSIRVPESVSSSAFSTLLPATVTQSGGHALVVKSDGTGLETVPVNPGSIFTSPAITGTVTGGASYSSPNLVTPIIQAYATASLPTAGTAGRVARVTDGIRGIWKDTGTAWVSVTGYADVRDFVTGGSGTSGSPWTGWEAGINALPVNTEIRFPGGYYTQSADIIIKRGWDVSGAGEELTAIAYTGIGKAWSIDGTSMSPDNQPRLRLHNFKLSTSTGTHGVEVRNVITAELLRLQVTGFSTAGIHLATPTLGTDVVLSMLVEHCDIYSNVIGILASGRNTVTNHIIIRDNRIRANSNEGIKGVQEVINWVIEGNDLEGNGLASINLPWVVSASIIGNYFESSAVGPAINISATNAAEEPGGIVIASNHIASTHTPTQTQTAIILGKTGLTYGVQGVSIHGNTFAGWLYAIDPVDVRGGSFGPDKYNGSTNYITTPGTNTTGLAVHYINGLKVHIANANLAGIVGRNIANNADLPLLGVDAGDRVVLGGQTNALDSGNIPRIAYWNDGSLPAGSAANNGLIAVAGTSHRLNYYSGGNQYYLPIGTTTGKERIQSGNCTLNGGATATCTFAVNYTSGTSYNCSYATETNTNAQKVVRTSATVVTVTSAVTLDTGVVMLVCVGT